jgi:hypothetical protein
MTVRMKTLIRGNTRAINVTFSNADGTPVDLTSASVFFAATTDAAPSSDSDAAINVGPITSHTAPTLGQTRIVLSAAQTRVTPATYNVGVQAVLADGTVIEDTGELEIDPDYKVATS